MRDPTQPQSDVTPPPSLPRCSMAFVAPLLALLVCAQGCGPTAPPRDYYFSPRGSDADGQGTPERPYGSIAKANELGLHAGDRILFEAGQTFDGNLTLDHHDAGTAERPVTIGSYGPGRATIRAGAGTAILVHNAGGVHVRDLVLVGDGAAQFRQRRRVPQRPFRRQAARARPRHRGRGQRLRQGGDLRPRRPGRLEPQRLRRRGDRGLRRPPQRPHRHLRHRPLRRAGARRTPMRTSSSATASSTTTPATPTP